MKSLEEKAILRIQSLEQQLEEAEKYIADLHVENDLLRDQIKIAAQVAREAKWDGPDA